MQEPVEVFCFNTFNLLGAACSEKAGLFCSSSPHSCRWQQDWWADPIWELGPPAVPPGPDQNLCGAPRSAGSADASDLHQRDVHRPFCGVLYQNAGEFLQLRVVCRAAGADGAQPHRDFRAIEHSAEVVWEFPKTLAAEPLLLEIVIKIGGCLDKLMCVCLREGERGHVCKAFLTCMKTYIACYDQC